MRAGSTTADIPRCEKCGIALVRECRPKNCDRCGWNPEVNRRRRKALAWYSAHKLLRRWGKNSLMEED